MQEIPNSIIYLTTGKMKRAEEQYYRENIDVGLMLKDYIESRRKIKGNYRYKEVD